MMILDLLFQISCILLEITVPIWLLLFLKRHSTDKTSTEEIQTPTNNIEKRHVPFQYKHYSGDMGLNMAMSTMEHHQANMRCD